MSISTWMLVHNDVLSWIYPVLSVCVFLHIYVCIYYKIVHKVQVEEKNENEIFLKQLKITFKKSESHTRD